MAHIVKLRPYGLVAIVFGGQCNAMNGGFGKSAFGLVSAAKKPVRGGLKK